jgi:hypothetical protein
MNKPVFLVSLFGLLLTGIICIAHERVPAPDYEIIKNYTFIENTTDYPRTSKQWIVYSDRSENRIYSESNCFSPIGKRVEYLEPFMVKQEANSSVEITEIKDKNNGTGWMPKDHVILFPFL